jgi:hypothetical protein
MSHVASRTIELSPIADEKRKISVEPRDSYKLEIDHISREEWTELLLMFDDASLYQTWEYGAARWGEDKLVHAVLKNGDEIAAAAQLWCTQFPVFGGGFAHISMGPLWRHRGKELNFKDVRTMIRMLYDEFVVKKRMLLRIRSHELDNEADGVKIRRILANQNMRQTSEPIDGTVILDLSSSLDEIRKNLKQSWRRQLKKAEQEDFEVLVGADSWMIATFTRIYREMVRRKQFQSLGSNPKELVKVQCNLPEHAKMMVFLCKHQGEIIGGQLLSVLGNTGIKLLAAISDSSLEFKHGISHYYEMRTVEWLKQNGFACYNLNGYDPERYPGPSRYKAGIGGEVAVYLGNFEGNRNRINSVIIGSWKIICDFIGLLKGKMPSLILHLWRKGFSGKNPCQFLSEEKMFN